MDNISLRLIVRNCIYKFIDDENFDEDSNEEYINLSQRSNSFDYISNDNGESETSFKSPKSDNPCINQISPLNQQQNQKSTIPKPSKFIK